MLMLTLSAPPEKYISWIIQSSISMVILWHVATIVTALQFMCISLIHPRKKRIKSYTAPAAQESRSVFYANGQHKETFEMQNQIH